MIIYKQVFPTRWPIFEFSFRVWRLAIWTAIMSESPESMTYEYVALFIRWGNREPLNLRLYETVRRVEDRLSGMFTESQPMALKRLYQWRRVLNEEIKRVKLSPNKEEDGK